MAEQAFPPEYTAQYQAEQERRQMAQLLFQRAIAQRPTEYGQGQVPVASRRQPLDFLASAVQAFVANKTGEDSRMRGQDILTSAQTAGTQDLQRVLGTKDPKQQVTEALLSKFPSTRKFGESRQKQLDERLGIGAKVAGDYGDPNAAFSMLNTGELPAAYSAPAIPKPSYSLSPQGNELATTYNRKGEPHVTVTKPAVISNTSNLQTVLPGMEGQQLFQERREDLGKWKERAVLAKSTLDANSTAIEALEEGAKAGGLEGFKQVVRKVAQGFGIETSNISSTEQLNMALGERVLQNARKLAPVTQEDVKRLEAILGSINTDPSALSKMLSITSAIAIRDIQNFQKFLGDQETNSTLPPPVRALYPGQGIGYEIPSQLPGKGGAAATILQELQKRGGDVSQFKIGGQSVPGDARFDIRNARFGQVPQTPAAAPPPPGLSPEEEKRYQDLKERMKKLGISAPQ